MIFLLFVAGIIGSLVLLCWFVHLVLMSKMAAPTARLGCYIGFHKDWFKRLDRHYMMECKHCGMTWINYDA